MKQILIIAIVTLATLTGCKKWSFFERREPVDEYTLHNQRIQKMITDSLATDERIEIVTFIQPDSSYYWRWTPWTIQNPDLEVSLVEDVRTHVTVSTLEITPAEDHLEIHHEQFYHGPSVGDVDVIDSIVCTDVSMPYEFIDSAMVLYAYRTTDEEVDSPWHITQEVDETYWCPSWTNELLCVRNVLQFYINDLVYYSVEMERNVIYP